MTRRTTIAIVAAMIVLMGYIVYGSMARVAVECELCVEFNGQTQCRKGAGATEEEARQSAQTSACGTLANGMNESIRCGNARPASVACQTT